MDLKPQNGQQFMEGHIRSLNKQIEELVSLNLWSARRLHKVHKEFAYNELDKITGEKHERV